MRAQLYLKDGMQYINANSHLDNSIFIDTLSSVLTVAFSSESSMYSEIQLWWQVVKGRQLLTYKEYPDIDSVGDS